MHHDCVIDIEVPGTAQAVLAHFTQPELLTTWWPEGAETDPHAGGEYHLWWEGPGWHLRGRYLDVGPTRVVFTWKWDHETTPEREVDVRIVQHDDRVHVSLRHEAHDDDERQSYTDGWEHFLGRLAERLGA